MFERACLGSVLVAAMISAAALSPVYPNAAQAEEVDMQALTWVEKKCVLYTQAWGWAYNSIGPSGISAAFIAQNDAFVAQGCTANLAVCPRSKEEFDMANMLTVMTMSEGMASTFVPFACDSEGAD